MRPIRLELENLRSFRKKRIIAFDGLQLFAIIGDTGAGKTSILEAITYALFNRTTWSGTNVRELISKGAGTMAVTFVFSVDGDEFTIRRITRDRGVPQHRLSCPARGIDVASESEVRDEVRAALHFDASAFLHTVLLPQGKHAELLTSSGSERNKILGELFRLDEIPAVIEKAKYHQGQAVAHLYGLNRERAALPTEPADAVVAAREVIAAATSHLDSVKAAAERARALEIAIAENRKMIEATSARVEQLRGIYEIPAKLAAIERLDGDLLRSAREHEEKRNAADSARAKANAEASSLKARDLDRDSVLGFDAVLNRVEVATREITREESEKKEKTRQEKEATKQLDDLARKCADVATQHGRAKEALTKAEAQLADTRRQKEQIELLNNAYQVARKNEGDRAAELDAKNASLLGGNERVKQADMAYTTAAECQQRAASALEHARISNGAAAVAAHLHAGEKCPVCDRKLPASFTPRRAEDIENTRRADIAAQQALRKAEADRVQVRSEGDSQRQAQFECQQRLDQAKKILASAKKDLAKVLTDHADDPAAVLATLTKAYSELTESVPTLRARYDEAAAQLRSLENEHASVKQKRIGCRDGAEALSKVLTRRRATRAQDIGLLPEIFAPGINGSTIDIARRAVKKALGEAGRIEKILAEAHATINVVTLQLSGIEQQRSTSIVAQRAVLYERLHRIGSLLKMPAMPDENAAQVKWAAGIVVEAKSEILKLEKSLKDNQREVHAQSDARRQLVEGLCDEPDAAHTAATIQLNEANRRLVEAQMAFVRVAEISAKIAKLEPAKLGLEILRDELGARRFAKYATEQRQARLLEEGTSIFRDMTGGRYSFTKNFQIWDDVTNEERPPQTLSGGEQFLASLSLSLAVVEIAANAGAKIEALFLDEGFASLDVETLEVAMMELRKRSRVGRSICVISHLSQVTKFVSDTFLVKAREEGSEVQHIEGPIDDDEDVVEGLVRQLSVRA